MKCETCNKGPAEGITVFRVNEKGVQGIWRCRDHLTSPQADALDPEVISIANIIDPPRPKPADADGASGGRETV